MFGLEETETQSNPGCASETNGGTRGTTLYLLFGKRCLDLTASTLSLLLLSPLFLLIALAIWFEDGGPVLFRQERVGRFGRVFRICKFRTMVRDSDVGSSVTVAGDKRLTRTGRLLRKWKLDELPQLLDVIRGEMSLVGPRPDVPGFADQLTGEERVVLQLRPGVTGPASIRYWDEEHILAQQEDPEEYNRRVLFPDKVRLNVEYARKVSFLEDVKCLIFTLLRYIWRPV